MRVIKFRGKRVDNKQLVYGYLFEDIKPKYKFSYIIKASFVPALTMPSSNFIEVIPETVGQYTGLTDKNGVEIYEGDICTHRNNTATIVFWEGAFIFNQHYIHDNALTNFACCRTFEIIGNIHDKLINT